MRVIDTNIFVRLLVADEPQQFDATRALIDREEVFVPVTVVLEAGWVLRSTFGRSEVEVAEDIADVAALPHVTIEAPERLACALRWTKAGMDFADALHLAAAREHDGFVTFDRALVKIATREGVSGVQLL